MKSTRRGFLGALVSLPFMGKLEKLIGPKLVSKKMALTTNIVVPPPIYYSIPETFEIYPTQLFTREEYYFKMVPKDE